MADIPATIEEIDARISAVRENRRALVEQAAAYSGAADDESISQRLADQEAELDVLMTRTPRACRIRSAEERAKRLSALSFLGVARWRRASGA